MLFSVLSHGLHLSCLQVCERSNGIEWPQEEETHLPRLSQIAQLPPHAYLLRRTQVCLQWWPRPYLPPLPSLALLRRPATLILNHPTSVNTQGGPLFLAVLLYVNPARGLQLKGCLCWDRQGDGHGMSQEGSEIELTRFLKYSSDNQHRIETLCEEVWSDGGCKESLMLPPSSPLFGLCCTLKMVMWLQRTKVHLRLASGSCAHCWATADFKQRLTWRLSCVAANKLPDFIA